MQDVDLTSLETTPSLAVQQVAPQTSTAKRYKGCIAIGLMLVTLLVCLPSTSLSGNRVLTASTAPATLLASSTLREDFLYCNDPYIGETFNDNARLDVWYQCEGPVYNEFAYDLMKYVYGKAHERLPSWGHRPTALPPKSKVLMFGNSHTRQIGQSFACQYADQVVKVQHLDARYGNPDPNMAVVVHFENGAQSYLVANSYVAHSPHWQRLLEAQIGLSLNKLDAIVLGLFNPGSKHWETDFVNTMLQMEASLPASDQVSVQDNYGPGVADLAAVYEGPIMFVTLFGTQEPARTRWARNQVEDLARDKGRRNVFFQSSRTYIDDMRQRQQQPQQPCEGASTSRLDIQDANNTNAQAHRCTGIHGGHADLVSWDVSEFFFAQIGQTTRWLEH